MVTPTATSTIVRQTFRFMEVTAPSSLADGSQKAADASEQYGIALKTCLEQEDFSFARRFTTLALSDTPEGEKPDPDLPNFHPLPGDCIKLRGVRDKTIKWRIDGLYLLSDQASAVEVMYTRLITDEKRLPAMFQTAVSYQLAVLLAPTYVGSRTKRADLVSDGMTALRKAIENDANSASHARWDGEPGTGDWANEATR
tara:strand:+ start:21797 stop:22393 length:597 start_codon:yes stop_codon:yes gene_type:complete